MQGLALVTFPAASAIFTSPSGFNLSSTQYGAMFIPQVVLAILASAFGPSARAPARLARRPAAWARAAMLLSMALLSASPLLIGSPRPSSCFARRRARSALVSARPSWR